ncbi:hypothetical protein GALL_418880 [mine drainage metagenome]|uniref:Uncharacterized protein n=1 Tax=mine drainage metagenome TaxID=410659 RepID=A0A1J5Q969_9ZZZZ
MLRLGADAQHVNPELAQGRHFRQQVIDAGRLGLDAVEHQKFFARAGAHQQAIGVLDAFELAVILGQIAVACGKAAGRKRQRHAAIGKHFGLHTFRATLLDQRQIGSTHLQRNDPAPDAQRCHPLQRRQVVDIQMRSGHERYFALQAMHGTHVIGFDHVAAIGGNLVQHRDISTRFNQHLGRQNDLFAGSL